MPHDTSTSFETSSAFIGFIRFGTVLGLSKPYPTSLFVSLRYDLIMDLAAPMSLLARRTNASARSSTPRDSGVALAHFTNMLPGIRFRNFLRFRV